MCTSAEKAWVLQDGPTRMYTPVTSMITVCMEVASSCMLMVRDMKETSGEHHRHSHPQLHRHRHLHHYHRPRLTIQFICRTTNLAITIIVPFLDGEPFMVKVNCDLPTAMCFVVNSNAIPALMVKSNMRMDRDMKDR